MKKISVSLFKKILDLEKNNSAIDFINVCTPVEYAEKHIQGVSSVPLDMLEKSLNRFKDKQTIYVHCRSGKRGEQAISKLQQMGIKADLINVEGGLMAWEESGFLTQSLSSRNKIPLMRQVFLVAGSIVLVGVLGYIFSGHNFFLILSGFIGFGLMFSGITGWCGLQLLLSKMPWNKTNIC